MNWALKGNGGLLKDKIFQLYSGMMLGRQGDVIIPDSRSSAKHARIVRSVNGDWVLEDNNSKNGTRIEGERITGPVTLKLGLTFTIGEQGFEIVELNPKAKESPGRRISKIPELKRSSDTEAIMQVVEAVAIEVAPQPAPEAPPKVQRFWYEILASFIEKHGEAFADEPRPVEAFKPALILDFIRGPQMNSHWTLGYGPRRIGSTSLDLPLVEPGAPAICFELKPSIEGIVFQTAHAHIVLLNGQSVDRRVLRVGDTIQVCETIIEVDFGE